MLLGMSTFGMDGEDLHKSELLLSGDDVVTRSVIEFHRFDTDSSF
jgi:hypothetical protein